MSNKIDPIELKLKALALRGRGKGKEGCPSDERFAAYMDGRLEGEEARKIRTHLTTCSDCHQAHAIWKETEPGDGPPVPARLLDTARSLAEPLLKRVVLKLMKKTFEILNPDEVHVSESMRPALGVATRSGEEEAPHHYEHVDIEPDLPCLKAVRIQHLEDTGTLKVSLEAAEDSGAQIRVDVYAGEKIVQSWPLGGEGVSLNPLEKGTYRIDVVQILSKLDKRRARSLGSMELDLRA